jgi:hypothetical protein
MLLPTRRIDYKRHLFVNSNITSAIKININKKAASENSLESFLSRRRFMQLLEEMFGCLPFTFQANYKYD